MPAKRALFGPAQPSIEALSMENVIAFCFLYQLFLFEFVQADRAVPRALLDDHGEDLRGFMRGGCLKGVGSGRYHIEG